MEHKQNSRQTEIFYKIDKLIGKYYKQMGVNSYFNNDGNGKFFQFIIDKRLNDDKFPISDQLGDDCNPLNCLYNKFDPLFPIDKQLNNYNDDTKHTTIFYRLRHCYKYNDLPSSHCMCYLLIFFVLINLFSTE